MRNIFIIYLTLSLSTCAQNSILGVWSSGSFPSSNYEFTANDSIVKSWINDIGSYKRKGVYRTSGDIVTIAYEPICEILNFIDSSGNDLTLIESSQTSYVRIYYKVFVRDSSYIVHPDSTGKTIFKDVATIDSIYFDSRKSFKNPFYQIDKNKLVPGIYEIKFKYPLLQYAFKSNTEMLLILNKKEIFLGIEYDPEINYINGILRRCKTKT
jgi:hypothetical protein